MRTAARDDFYVARGRRVWRGWLGDLELHQARWGRRPGAWLYYRRLFHDPPWGSFSDREEARRAAWAAYDDEEEEAR